MNKVSAIKPWIFEFMQAIEGPVEGVAPAEITATFNDTLAIWLHAEELDFEGVFFSEHHFWMSYSPSPNLLIATLAAHTKRLRLGVMGMVLPFYHPWRILEEIFMLDHLTKGRLEIGCAMGVPAELTRIGMDLAEARERFDEALEILDAGLTAPIISHHGRYWDFDDLSILPRPLQQPAPPRWTTVVSTGSAEKSAARGSKICTSFESVRRVNEIFDAYRATADSLGYVVGPDHLGLRRNVFISRNESEAKEWADAAFTWMMDGLSSDPRVKSDPNAILDAPKGGSGFSVHEDEFIAGTPAQVAEQIVEQCRVCGSGHFLATLGRGGQSQRHEIVTLFGEEVVPALRAAEVT